MTAGAVPGLVYACMTHVPLWIDYPSFVSTICLGQAQGPGQLNLRDLAPEWEPYHPILGGTAGSFALKNHLLAHHPDATHVGICQYRKFLSRARIGVPAKNYEVMDILPRSQVRTEQLAELMSPNGAAFLLGQPGQFLVRGTSYDYLYQYKDVHHVEDLLRFTALAVELGVLDKNDVHPFFGEKIFFPGGIELGVFPAGFWLKSITGLETVVRECVKRYPTPREGTQARSWSFCMERLGSFLLLKHLRQTHAGENWITRYAGFLNLVTEAEDAQYVPGT